MASFLKHVLNTSPVAGSVGREICGKYVGKLFQEEG